MRSLFRTRPVPKVAALGVLVLVSAYLVAGPTTSPEAAAAVGALTWADEFDGPAGTAPDPGRWGRDTGGSGFGNNELQYYTTGAANAALDGQGNLVITARRENPANYQCWYGTCQYTSARLNTAGRFIQAYGRFEARLKVPRGQGLWPAFWMLGNDIGSVGWPNSGEIDVMENVGFEPNTVHGSMHGPGYSGGNPLTGTYSLLVAPPSRTASTRSPWTGPPTRSPSSWTASSTPVTSRPRPAAIPGSSTIPSS
jgi:beta-glucanase (GH16 family)